MSQNFGYTILYVGNVAATLVFYQQALGLTRRFLFERGDDGELDVRASRTAPCVSARAVP